MVAEKLFSHVFRQYQPHPICSIAHAPALYTRTRTTKAHICMHSSDGHRRSLEKMVAGRITGRILQYCGLCLK
ncbi:hypothetical protein GBAR_LOCUS15817 [Geodia barretti]|uniref:Uncharacterized protein n=1 Tax=Geodia barretti TaxID=519541 RepID=A0AA35SE50_GEOBA|nr:hypothetical protein GBAR_LOCUS15817 [Geodia barretti]